MNVNNSLQIKRVFIFSIFLIFIFSGIKLSAQDSCLRDYTEKGRVFLGNTHNGGTDYYRNLILQDISNAGGIDLPNDGMTGAWSVEFGSEQDRPGRFEIRVHPPQVTMDPLLYKGFDISEALSPDQAKISFRLSNQLGIVSDSLSIFEVPVNGLSNNYVVRSVSNTKKETLKLKLSHISFTYTSKAYQVFRDKVQIIDNYYAAAALIDSLLQNTSEISGFYELPLPYKIIQYAELLRIRDYIGSYKFLNIPEIKKKDPASLNDKLILLERRTTRIATILAGDMTEMEYPGLEMIYDAHSYVDRLFYYLSWSDKVDHSYNLFYKNLASLEPGADGELHYIHAYYTLNGKDKSNAQDAKKIILSLAHGMMTLADSCYNAGLFSEASIFYKNTSLLARYAPGEDFGRDALMKAANAEATIRKFYLDIAGKALSKKNPEMAENYFLKAYMKSSLFGWPVADSAGDILRSSIRDLYLSSAFRLIDGHQYEKAMEYLEKVRQSIPRGSASEKTMELQASLKKAREDIYLGKLEYSGRIFKEGNVDRAEELRNEAVDFRLYNPYEIPRDVLENKVNEEIDSYRFRQYLARGEKNLNSGEFHVALYYFEKAKDIEPFNFKIKGQGRGYAH